MIHGFYLDISESSFSLLYLVIEHLKVWDLVSSSTERGKSEYEEGKTKKIVLAASFSRVSAGRRSFTMVPSSHSFALFHGVQVLEPLPDFRSLCQLRGHQVSMQVDGHFHNINHQLQVSIMGDSLATTLPQTNSVCLFRLFLM